MFVVSCVLVIIVVESLKYVQKNTDTVYRGENPLSNFFMCYCKGYVPRTIFSSMSPVSLTTFSFRSVFVYSLKMPCFFRPHMSSVLRDV